MDQAVVYLVAVLERRTTIKDDLPSDIVTIDQKRLVNVAVDCQRQLLSYQNRDIRNVYPLGVISWVSLEHEVDPIPETEKTVIDIFGDAAVPYLSEEDGNLLWKYAQYKTTLEHDKRQPPQLSDCGFIVVDGMAIQYGDRPYHGDHTTQGTFFINTVVNNGINIGIVDKGPSLPETQVDGNIITVIADYGPLLPETQIGGIIAHTIPDISCGTNTAYSWVELRGNTLYDYVKGQKIASYNGGVVEIWGTDYPPSVKAEILGISAKNGPYWVVLEIPDNCQTK